MTTLNAVPLDAIAARARRVEPARVAFAALRLLVTAVAGLLYLLGRSVAAVLRGIWFGAAWVGAAVAEGWSDGWPRADGERDG